MQIILLESLSKPTPSIEGASGDLKGHALPGGPSSVVFFYMFFYNNNVRGRDDLGLWELLSVVILQVLA
jgi:hypothetical protein